MLQGSRRSSAYRRTRAAAAASGMAVLAAVLLAPPSAAQAPQPETGEIRNGTAKAVATVVSAAPGVGALALGVTAGTAVTQVTNSLAQATSQTANLGLIGTSLTEESCTGGDPTIRPEDLPQPLGVDNRGGAAVRTAAEAGQAGMPGAVGEMEVRADQDPPTSSARTTLAALGVPGGPRIGGGEARTTTRVLPGQGREAVASVSTSLSVAGVLELDGLHWRAHHRTGVDPHAEGTFEVAAASVGGIPVPIDDLASLEDALNGLLGQAGIRISLPSVERIHEPADLVRVTPLVIEMRDTPVGQAILGPILDLTREQRGQLFDELVALACQAASALLIADVVVSVAGGTGFLTVGIGGVEASSADLEVGDPFGAHTGDPGVPPPELGGDVPGPEGSAGAGGAPSSPAPGPELASPGSAPAAGDAVASGPSGARPLGAFDELCESLHPNGTPCSEGAASVVGALGLLTTVGIAGADTLRQRRRAELVED